MAQGNDIQEIFEDGEIESGGTGIDSYGDGCDEDSDGESDGDDE